MGLDRRCAGFARAHARGGRHLARAPDQHARTSTTPAGGSRAAAGRPGVDADAHAQPRRPPSCALEEAPRRRRCSRTFDYSPAVLRAVRTGRMEFAVDQQPYLQGYLPVVFLAERARYGLFPAQGEVVPTGPSFITAADAAQAERLSLLGIR